MLANRTLEVGDSISFGMRPILRLGPRGWLLGPTIRGAPELAGGLSTTTSASSGVLCYSVLTLACRPRLGIRNVFKMFLAQEVTVVTVRLHESEQDRFRTFHGGSATGWNPVRNTARLRETDIRRLLEIRFRVPSTPSKQNQPVNWCPRCFPEGAILF